MGKALPNFTVSAMGEWPAVIPPRVCGIINTATRDTGGEHWVAYFNSPQRQHVVYWDSFGMPPDARLLEFLKTSGKRVVRNTTHVQHIKAESCGYWAIRVLKQLHAGQSIGRILSELDAHDQQSNEQVLQQQATDPVDKK